MPLRLHRMPYAGIFPLWCVLLPLWYKKWKQGKIRLWTKVRISTVFGTMAVLVGSIVVVAELWNYLGVVLGTWYILADLLWSASDNI